MIADQCPNLKIAIDHLGVFLEDKGMTMVDQVVKELPPLASRPNIAVKASALLAHSAAQFPFRDLDAPLHDVLDALGLDRVHWDSDLARLPESLSKAVTMFTEVAEFMPGSALENVIGRPIIKWIGS
jgi:predicted TIM-barrel fold metal-dependent hydrolase